LPNYPNIHWLGQRAYTDLPALVKAFDVCLMPFALNEATQYINPTKTLEYMAAGKPVVSTAVPDVLHHFTPIVDVALTAEEFIAAIQRAARNPRAESIEQGIDRAHRPRGFERSSLAERVPITPNRQFVRSYFRRVRVPR
jgi:glycosyltransferase involved in cell wall biosynthesis